MICTFRHASVGKSVAMGWVRHIPRMKMRCIQKFNLETGGFGLLIYPCCNQLSCIAYLRFQYRLESEVRKCSP
jgi:hypothetical protein